MNTTTTRPGVEVISTVTFPGGAVAVTVKETVLAYTNLFGEELRVPMDPESEVGQQNYAWRKEYENEDFPRATYTNVRWETRTVTTTTNEWVALEENHAV